MEYLVTGATGFVGGAVTRQLVEAGHLVRALVRDPGKAKDLAALGVNLFKGDVTERETLRGPMTGVDGVFHIGLVQGGREGHEPREAGQRGRDAQRA